MNSTARLFNPSEAARQLGVSTKALRVYEQQGLITPGRTSTGWRVYGPDEMSRAADIVQLRALGFSLNAITRILDCDTPTLDRTLAAHKETLENRVRELSQTIDKVGRLRADLGRGKVPATRELIRLLTPTRDMVVALDLPWPWGGEPFEFHDVRSLNYLVGPLGSGKTQLAKHLAAALPDAVFLGLDRFAGQSVEAQASLNTDAASNSRIGKSLAAIIDDGGAESAALLALLTALAQDDFSVLVVDMLEHGLDAATQEALIVHLRQRGPTARPLFFTTRSNLILDLDSVGPDEAIILCPANHSPPSVVIPHPGCPGYEAVASCLAAPDVRARTAGMIAHFPSD